MSRRPSVKHAAVVLTIASMTSSASPVSTVSDPAVAGWSARKSSINSFMPWGRARPGFTGARDAA